MVKIFNGILVAVVLASVCCLGSAESAVIKKTEVVKSKLVRSLESIFYDLDFAKVGEHVYKAGDYGAVGDGRTLDTKAIQKTIDAAAVTGGVVTFAPGTYLSGALFVKSDVELRLDEGVVIQAIQDTSQYRQLPTRIAGFEMAWPAALINVYEQSNVRITGKGVIDGNGSYWWEKYWGKDHRGGMRKEYEKRGLRWAVDYDCERVRAVVVWKSQDVLLKDFTIKRSGFWTISLTYSDRVHVDGVIIRNNIGGYGPSSDGINTDSSSNVLVENCDISCNDDNLCLKSGRDADGLRVNRPCENVVYRNCITREGHGLFTLGSETSGGMRNIEVYGLKAIGTTTGIRFKSAKIRGGVMENIYIHDIEMEGVSRPFHFELNWYPSYSYPTIPKNIPAEEISDRWKLLTQRVEPPEKGIPEFRNITISDVTVVGASRAFYVNSYSEKPMHNVSWKNVSIEAKEAGKIKNASDWTMENVLLDTKDGKQVELKNCRNVALPRLAGNRGAKSETSNSFPEVSKPIAITSGPMEHFFASYYGINSWSGDQRYVTVLQTPIKYRLPGENDAATLGLVDLKTNEFIPLAETRAWNFQQGCMAHWLGTFANSRIIYNDIVDGKYVSIIMDVHTKRKIRTIGYPVAAVSPNGKEAVCINFSRLRNTREAYGYGGGGQDAKLSVQFPKDDGLILVDLETGKGKVLVSIYDVKDQVPDVPKDGIEYFNHVLFSREGGRIFWLARAIPKRNTTSFTVSRDGTNLQRCFPDGWRGSHYDWLNENELMVTAKYKGKDTAHVLFTIGRDDYKRLGNGLLDYDGHGTFSPDGKWMVTDTYPSKGLYEQKLYLMNMKTEAVLPLGRYVHHPEFRKNGKDAACDLHPRWSPKSDMIGFNSVNTGQRQAYIIKLKS